MRYIATIIFAMVNTVAASQTVFGKVVDELNSPLPFVIITLNGSTIGTMSDIDGKYSIELTKDVDTLTFSFIGYSSVTKVVGPGELDVMLGFKTEMIDMVEIIERANRNNEIILLLDKKSSVGVESSIGSSELSKKGISNVQDGLNKIGGVTFDGDKINVRGLGDRYNQVTLNGLPISSNNSDRKNLNLSMLPSALLENVKVKKTYTSDQWSNLAGAQVDINSKNVRDITKASISYGLNSRTDGPLNRGTVTIGRNKDKLGYLISLDMRSSNQENEGSIRMVNTQGNYLLNYNFNDNNTSSSTSLLAVTSYEGNLFRAKNSTFSLFQSNISDRTTFGTHFDYESDLFTTRTTPTRNNLFVNQLNLDCYHGDLTWENTLGFSRSRGGERERRQFVYLYDGTYSFNNIDKLDNHIFSNENLEDKYTVSSKLIKDMNAMTLHMGYAFMYTENIFDYNQTYFDLYQVNQENYDINPNSPYDFITEENTLSYEVNNPASYVEGITLINGGFIRADYTLNRLDISAGLRLEGVYQSVKYTDQLIPSITRQHIQDNAEILPHLSAKFRVSEKDQFRFSSSITTVRPRFRELTPFIYTEVFAGTKVQGNPNLINSIVTNLDLAYEIYPSSSELISFSVYGKMIQDPIERVNVATASGRLETYQNAKLSNVIGCEIDFRKQFNKLRFDSNISLLNSTISVSNEGQSSIVVTNLERSLQGSSPILANVDIFYDLSDNNKVGLTYNFVGKKLNSVGIFGLGDIYQRQQHFFNLIYTYSNEGLSTSIRLNNIFDTRYILEQETDLGSMITNEFRNGTNLTLNVRYSI